MQGPLPPSPPRVQNTALCSGLGARPSSLLLVEEPGAAAVVLQLSSRQVAAAVRRG